VVAKDGSIASFVAVVSFGKRPVLSNCCNQLDLFTFESGGEVKAECTATKCFQKNLQRARLDPQITGTIFKTNLPPSEKKVLLSRVTNDYGQSKPVIMFEYRKELPRLSANINYKSLKTRAYFL